jgi:hypothetical protein
VRLAQGPREEQEPRDRRPTSRRPGLGSDALLGLYKEKAASCRFTNVQSPEPSAEALGYFRGALPQRIFMEVIRHTGADLANKGNRVCLRFV